MSRAVVTAYSAILSDTRSRRICSISWSRLGCVIGVQSVRLRKDVRNIPVDCMLAAKREKGRTEAGFKQNKGYQQCDEGSTILSTTKPSWSLVAAASVWARKKSISARSLPDKPWASKKYTTTSGWLAFMDYDLGYFDLETRVLEPLENPFGPKVLPMS
jgi:hypothetical protein